MRFECRTAEPNTPASRRRAEEWVRDKLKPFVPSREQALRMRTLEAEAEQVKLAFYGISTTCEQFLRGTMDRDVADNSLHGYEQTIANFLHDVSGETVVVADRAQVAELPAIQKSPTEIGATGRQAALLGEGRDRTPDTHPPRGAVVPPKEVGSSGPWSRSVLGTVPTMDRQPKIPASHRQSQSALEPFSTNPAQ